ncbi:uncharacterized protein LOC110822332 [Carica papaya]|uniref:uncharacterized protein LOC110822332 n=1 Tax=Carica papaya TaxID=3649 RepID=UPI000B8CB443|nr:uncharacterized protein LOC110822332 [Carica papaya]
MGLGTILPQHPHHQPHLRQFLPRLADQPRGKPIKIQTYAGLSMRLGLRGDLTWKQASATNSILNAGSSRFQDPRRPFCINTSKMATKNDESKESVAATAKKDGGGGKGERKLSLAPVPPPPEKPEPGDCCGSGCVRCVWDVYYEELEAYNKLYKYDSNDSKSKPS